MVKILKIITLNHSYFDLLPKHMEYQLPWPKSSLNLSMPRSHLFSKMEQIRPMDLSTTPPPMENSEENNQENTQIQIGNYYISRSPDPISNSKTMNLEFSRIYFFSSLKRSDWLRN